MAVLSGRQRVFSAAFSPEESPFLSGFVQTERLRSETQRQWDTVAGILKPDFSQPCNEQRLGEGKHRDCIRHDISVAVKRQKCLGRTR